MLNVELDHHTRVRVARGGSGALRRLDVARSARRARGGARARRLRACAARASTTGATRRRRSRRSSSAASSREDATPHVAAFAGAARRFELRGEAGGVLVYDDYAHHPTEVAATLATAREVGAGRVLVLFQPHLYSRTRHLAHEFGRALAAADVVAVADVYAAREHDGDVRGKLVVDAVADARARRARRAGCRRPSEGARWLASLARPGDVVLTVGAGDVDGAVPVLLEALA